MISSDSTLEDVSVCVCVGGVRLFLGDVLEYPRNWMSGWMRELAWLQIRESLGGRPQAK